MTSVSGRYGGTAIRSGTSGSNAAPNGRWHCVNDTCSRNGVAASRCVSMNAAAAAACSSGTVAICRANPIQCGSFGTISRPHSTVR